MDYGSLRSVPAVLCLAFMLPGMLGCAGVCAALCPIGWCPVSTWTMCARGVSGIVGGMESIAANAAYSEYGESLLIMIGLTAVAALLIKMFKGK